MSELLTSYERSILKDSINAKYGCDPECADRKSYNNQSRYCICIAYSKKLYSLDDAANFIESFKTAANTRYTAIFNSSDIFVKDSEYSNQNIIVIRGFLSKAHASNYIEVIESLKDTFEYDAIDFEPYEIVYNNTYSSDKDNDNANHPEHYIQDGIETIDVIKAWTKGLDGIIATDTGNVIKYISRWGKKNGLEDLKKAQWYLNHLIKEMEERMENDCCC